MPPVKRLATRYKGILLMAEVYPKAVLAQCRQRVTAEALRLIAREEPNTTTRNLAS